MQTPARDEAALIERRERSMRYLERRLRLLDHHVRSILAATSEQELEAAVAKHQQAGAAARDSVADVVDKLAPGLERLRRTLGLTPFELDAVVLAVAPLIDSRFQEAIVELKGTLARTSPDVGLALDLFSASFSERMANRTAFGPRGTLVINNVIELDHRESRDGNLLDVTLRPSQRALALVLESDDGDPTLEGYSRLIWPTTSLEDVVLAEHRVRPVLDLVSQYDVWSERRESWGWTRVGDGGSSLVLLFCGPPGTGKTLLSHALAHELGRPLLTVDAQQLGDRRHIESDLNAILREARLQSAVIFFDECEALFGSRFQGNRAVVPLLKALDAWDGVAILTTNIPQALDAALDRRITLQLDFEVPGPSLRAKIWRRHVPPEAPLATDVDLPFLAEKYEFAGGHIRNSVVVALNRALARSADDTEITMADFESAARSQVRHRLKQLADNTGTHLTLKDLILPRDIKSSLEAIIAAVRNRRIIFDEWGFGEKLTKGRGLCSLFRGDSGTGKTLAAEILANELAMPLYRVRIPAIVDKYIGETEKNLEKCFHEAALAGALLLFDEADSIFSKRVEVNSSNDRHSNMEVNLLLQEIERFEGVVILTTNLDAAIDDAFDRRLNFKIDFPFPDAKARARIWRHLIPDRAPIDGEINFRYLGKDYELSGGSIKNAVVRAAYAAAERKQGLGMEMLEEAAIQEYRELGKLIPMHRNPWD